MCALVRRGMIRFPNRFDDNTTDCPETEIIKSETGIRNAAPTADCLIGEKLNGSFFLPPAGR